MPERIKYLFIYPDRIEQLFFNLDEEALAYQKKFHPHVKMVVISDEHQTILLDNSAKPGMPEDGAFAG